MDDIESFSTQNKLVIAATIILYILNAYHAAMSQVLGFLNSSQDSELFTYLVTFQDQIVVSIIDFLTLFGLVYLFSYQGQQSMKIDETAGHRKTREVALQDSTREFDFEVEVGKDRNELRDKSETGTINTQDLKDILLAPDTAVIKVIEGSIISRPSIASPSRTSSIN